jgi:hypothetical protein
MSDEHNENNRPNAVAPGHGEAAGFAGGGVNREDVEPEPNERDPERGYRIDKDGKPKS